MCQGLSWHILLRSQGRAGHHLLSLVCAPAYSILMLTWHVRYQQPPSQVRCWGSGSCPTSQSWLSGNSGPSQRLSSHCAAPALSLQSQFPNIQQDPSYSLDRPVFAKSTLSCHPNFGTSNKPCAQPVTTCFIPKAFLHRKMFRSCVRKSNGSRLFLFHRDYAQFTECLREVKKLIQGHRAGEKEFESRSSDSKLVMRHDTKRNWHVGTLRRGWLSVPFPGPDPAPVPTNA